MGEREISTFRFQRQATPFLTFSSISTFISHLYISMPLVVQAIHTFVAEHGDELEFTAGEDIEVLEKDDAFGDGWWRVSYHSFTFVHTLLMAIGS